MEKVKTKSKQTPKGVLGSQLFPIAFSPTGEDGAR